MVRREYIFYVIASLLIMLPMRAAESEPAACTTIFREFLAAYNLTVLDDTVLNNLTVTGDFDYQGIPICTLLTNTSLLLTATSADIPNTLVLRDNTGSFYATTITLTGVINFIANNNTVALSPNPVTTPYTFSLPPNSGSIGYVLTTDGTGITSWQPVSAVGAITDLNNLATSTQFFAVGTAGTGFNIVSAGSTHTFNIPFASTLTVTAGTISNTDYTNFVNTYTTVLAATSLDVPNTLVLRDNTGSFAATNITVTGVLLFIANNNTLTLQQNPSTSGYTLMLPSNAGINGYILTTDGNGVTSWQPIGTLGDLTVLNNLTTSTQLFANGFAGIQPAFNSALNTHTLNIPLASTYGVLAGLITSTDYFNFRNTFTTVAPNFTITGDTGSATGQTISLTAKNTSGSSVTFQGSGTAMTLNTTDSLFNTMIGLGAGNTLMTGSGNTALGYNAGSSLTTGFGNTFIGYLAGSSITTGSGNVFIGANTGSSSSSNTSFSVAVGYNIPFVPSNSVLLGYQAASSDPNSVAVGYLASTSGANSIAAGYTTAASGVNSIALGYQTSVTGINSTGIGSLATVLGANAVGAGYATQAFTQATTFGYQTTATTAALAVGYLAAAAGIQSIAIGNRALASQTNSIALGNQVTAAGVQSIMLGGISNTVTGTQSTVIGGNNNSASGFNSYAFGQFAQASNNYSFVYSDSTLSAYSSHADNSFNVRAGGGAYFDANVTLTGVVNFVAANGNTVALQENPSTNSYTLQLPINGGTNNYVLTTDGTGVTSWQAVAALPTGITSLNTLTTSTQFFTNGSSGVQPQFVSLGTTHTLNIPLASTYGVLAGLITSTDYYNFQNTYTTVVSLITGDIGSVNGQAISLKAGNTAGYSVTFTASNATTLVLNVTNLARLNTMVGLKAGNTSISSSGNVGFGYQAGANLTSAAGQFIGANAGFGITTAGQPCCIGYATGSGIGNAGATLLGQGAFPQGSNITSIGQSAGASGVSIGQAAGGGGGGATVLGQGSGNQQGGGNNFNTIIGQSAGTYTGSSSGNTLIGQGVSGRAGESNATRIGNNYIADSTNNSIFAGLTSGNSSYTSGTAVNNSALGVSTLTAVTTGNNNTALGAFALANLTTGTNNIAIGINALYTLTNTSNAIGIGQLTSAAAGAIAVGHFTAAPAPNSIMLGGISNTVTGTQATVIGGNNNSASGFNSYALGQFAQANNNYSFVYSDSTTSPYQSRANNSFNVRAAGGAYFDANVTLTGIVNFSANSNTLTLKPNPSTANYSFQLPPNAGFNTYLLTTDGTGITSWRPVSATGAITALNNLTTSTQFFANGFAGIQPQFNSALTTHTLNIPLASTYGVLAGLITSTDYFNFQNTYTTIRATAASSFITTITGDSGTATGQKISLTAKNIAGSSTTFQGSGTTMTFNVTDTRFNTIIGLNAGNSLITGTGNTALGFGAGGSLSTGYGNVLLGYQAGNQFSTHFGNVFMSGTNSSGTANGCIAMGFNFVAANNSVGIGTSPVANGTVIGALSITNNIVSAGVGANTTGVNSTGIGRLATILSTSAVGIGFSTQAFTQAAALGYQTTATAGAVAVGYIATATGVNSIALGYLATATGLNSIAIGNQTAAYAPNSIMLGGISNTISGIQATVIGGNKNSASGLNSYALGQNASATNNYSFVYSDSTASTYASRANNSFNVRALGGAYFDANITLTGVINFSANNNTLTLQPNPTTSSYTFQLPANAGYSNYLLTTNGSGVTSWQPLSATGAITTLNNLSTSTQFFANGSAGITPNFSSALNTHTLNIPLASTNGVLAGLITSTDYFNFQNTYTTIRAGPSYITTITGDSGSATGQTIFLTARTTAGSSVSFQGTGTTMTLNTTDALFNTMIGLGAGNTSITGNNNTALGYQAGSLLISGSLNTFVGYQSGVSNTSGSFNTFTGYQAGAGHTTGSNNTFIGYRAGATHTTASGNTFVGSNAGTAITTGGNNTMLGYNAGANVITGASNTFVGANTGSAYTGNETNNIIIGQGITGISGENNITRIGNNYIADTASNNIFVGVSSGNTNYTVGTAVNNSALGVNTLSALTTGTNNTALGAFALANLTTGTNNIAIGVNALSTLTNISHAIGIGLSTQVTAPDGIALGRQAQAGGQSLGIGSLSSVLSTSAVGIGYATQAFTQATTLGYQTTATTGALALGYQAAATGASSVAIGYQAFAGGAQAVVINGSGNSATGTASFAIGTNAAANANGSFVWADGSGTGLTSTVANSFNVYASGGVFMPSSVSPFGVSGSAVLVNTTNGQLGTVSSSQRYKDNIKPMSPDYSDNLLALQPVTFNYKTSPEVESFGLIAEDVHEYLPQLVIYNTQGQPETVKYHELPVLLLNELKKSCAITDSLEEQVFGLHGNLTRVCNSSFQNFVVQLDILANNLKVCNNTTLNNLTVDGNLTLCGLPACSWAQTYTLLASATAQDVPNTLVLRDNTGSFAATTITVTGNALLQSVKLAPNPATTSYTLQLPGNGGTNNYVLTTDGTGTTSWQPVSAVGGITSLNNLATSTQFFAVGTAGTGFNIVSAGNTHTFNIPLASTLTVTAGTLSNADYTNFVNTYTTVLAATSLDTPSTLVLRDSMGSFAATTITVTGNIALKNVTLAANSVTTPYAFQLPTNSGTNNYVLTTNGAGITSWQSISAVGAITSLNGLATSTQFFANSFAAIQPQFVSLGNTHTLNIPLASTYGVLAGLITSTDYYNFRNTYTTVLQPLAITGDTGSISGSILTLKANATAGGTVNFIGTGTAMTFNTGDSSQNVFIGKGAGVTTNINSAATAFGYNAASNTTPGNGVLIAIGAQALTGNRAFGIGYQVQQTGVTATAIGYRATGVGYQASGIGYLASSGGASSGAVGSNATSPGANSTAIGFTANTSGVSSTVIGTLANARFPNATGVGYQTNAFAQASALGYQTTATTNAVAIGYLATATGTNSIAIGNNALASLGSAIAIGNQVTAAGVNSIILGGISNTVTGTQATVIGGNNNQAAGLNSYALGQYANAVNNYSFVFSDSTTTPYQSRTNNSFNVRAAGGAYFDAQITLTGALNFVANNGTTTLKPNASTASYTFQLPVNGGTNNYVLTTDGTGVTSWQPASITAAGITTLNGLTAQSQFFANGYAGLQPAFNSLGTTHTLNIPLASSYGVLAGLITSTDYYNFKLAASYITTITGDTGTISGRTVSLQAHNTAGSSVTFQASGSSITLNVTDTLFNTIIGNAAGNFTLTGTNNVFFGFQSGKALSTGFQNTIIGGGALLTTGTNNTCVPGGNLTTGAGNTFVGPGAGGVTTTGSGNTCAGINGGGGVTIATNNTLIGGATQITTGGNNVIIGQGASGANGGNSNNTVIGTSANPVGATGNIAIGNSVSGRAGINNFTIIGNAFIADTTNNSIFSGPGAGNKTYTSGTAVNNSALGASALTALTTGTNNTVLGAFALKALTTGINNIAIGVNALSTLTNTSNTIGIGQLSSAQTGAIAIGHFTSAAAPNSIMLGGISNTVTGTQATVLGGNNNSASGFNSYALGQFAQANNNCSFVYSDSTLSAYSSHADNSFNVRALGGAYFDANITLTGVVNFSANNTLTLQPNPSTSSYTLQLPINGGTNSYVLVTDGTGITSWQTVSGLPTGITSLNNLTTSTQFFANGSSGLQPQFVSLGNTHTLNIPLASTYGVLAGLITSTDYFNFQNTYTTVFARTITGDTGFVAGQVISLQARATAGSSVTFQGSGTAMTLNTTDSLFNTMLGLGAGNTLMTGSGNTALGYNAGSSLTTGFGNTFIGYSAGSSITTGSGNTFIGFNTGSNSSPNTLFSVAVGYNIPFVPSNSVLVGYQAASSDPNTVAVGYLSSVSGANSIALGYTTAVAGANSIALGYQTSVTGVNSTGIGSFASVVGSNAVGVGYATQAFTQATTLGYQTTATTGALALGYSATAGGINGIAIGNRASASQTGSIAIGNQTTAAGVNSIALGGISNTVTGAQSTVIGGNNNNASGFNSYALGQFASASNNYSFVYSDSTATTYSSNADNSFNVRAFGGAYFDANITLTGALNFLAPNGNTVSLQENPSTNNYTFQLPINGGTNNYVLSTDGTGVTSWQAVAALPTGITSLNTLTTSTQFFATGSSGVQPQFISLGTTHTLNIPLASTYGTLAGLITSTDYFNFQNTYTTVVSLITGDIGSVNGSAISLKANPTAGYTVTFTASNSTTLLFNVTSIAKNTFIGLLTGNSTLTGGSNTCLGYNVLPAATSCANTVSIGSKTNSTSTTSANNVCLGATTIAGLGGGSSGSIIVGYNNPNSFPNGNNAIIGSLCRGTNNGGASASIGFNAGGQPFIASTAGHVMIGANTGTATPNGTGGHVFIGQGIAGINNASSVNDTRIGNNYIADGVNNCIFVGPNAGNTTYTIGTANNNCAFGANTLSALTTGTNNTALGAFALSSLTTGSNNIAIGVSSLVTLTSTSNTIGIGQLTQVTAPDGIAFGRQAQAGAQSLGIGSFSTVLSSSAISIGYSSQAFTQATTLGYQTTATTRALALGYQATSTGISSVAIGYQAFAGGTNAVVINGLSNSATGTASFAAGTKAAAAANGSFVWADGSGTGLTSSVVNSFNVLATGGVFMQGINGANVGASSSPVLVSSSGQLGVTVSSARYKDNIKPMPDVYSSDVLKLQPATFNYKTSPGIENFGLIAEQVHELLPQLVVYNDRGEPETVKYHELSILLLNELKKDRARINNLYNYITILQEALESGRSANGELSHRTIIDPCAVIQLPLEANNLTVTNNSTLNNLDVLGLLTICGVPVSLLWTATSADIPNTLVLRDNTGSFAATTITVTGAINFQASNNNPVALQDNPATSSYTFTLPGNAGINEYVLSTNGVGATSWQPISLLGGITDLNNLSTSTQFFAFGTAGTALNIISSGNTHTFNLPLASTLTVTAGTLSNIDYTHFVNTYTTVLAATPLDIPNTLALRDSTGSFAATNMTITGNIVLQNVTLAPNPSTSSYTFQLPVNGGTNNYVLTTNGSGITSWQPVTTLGGITTLNNLTTTTQFFANGFAGVQPQFVSLGNTHTLNIPLASTYGVLAGLITSTDYFNFQNTYTTVNAGSFVMTITGDSGTARGQTISLTARNSAGSSVTFRGTGTAITLNVTDTLFNTMVGLGAGNTLMTGTANTALGYNAGSFLTTGYGNVFLGYQAGSGSSAPNAVTSGSGNVFMSATNSSNNGSASVIFGFNFGVSNNSVGIGGQPGANSVVVGPINNITSTIVSIGSGANITGLQSTGIGRLATILNPSAIAIGFTAQAFTQAAALGYQTTATAGAVAVGYIATATGVNSVAIGFLATATGLNSIAIGSQTAAYTPNSIMLGGIANTVTGIQATVIGGNKNSSSGLNSYAFGQNASASNSYSFVYSDSTATAYSSHANNSFNVRALGGAYFDANITLTGVVNFSANNNTLTLQPNSATSSYTFQLPPNAGFNTYLLTTNGTGITSWQPVSATGAITALNNLTTSTQFFANGSGGITPNFASALNTHTLNIPLASSYGVLAGLITSTDYFNFQNTYTTILAGPSYITTITGDLGSAAGPIISLTARNTAGSSMSFQGTGTTMTLNTTDTLFNTMVGLGAGNRALTGTNNAALGYQAGASLTTGLQNTFIGSGAGARATTGTSNTFVGFNAGYNTTTGTNNTFAGSRAGFSNISGSYNVAIGDQAGYSMNASFNTLCGQLAGALITTGSSNTVMGQAAANFLTTGNNNIIIGQAAGQTYTSSESNNIIIGQGVNGRAGENFVTRIGNNYIADTANASIFVGITSGNSSYTRGTAVNNSTLGVNTLSALTTGTNNTALGAFALATLTTGINNIAIGVNALSTLTNASNAIGIGQSTSAQTGAIAIGHFTMAAGPNSMMLGGISNTVTGAQATVIGGNNNSASGFNSYALGQFANANNNYSFVFSDSTLSAYSSRAANSFNVRAVGGAYFDANITLTGAVSFAANNSTVTLKPNSSTTSYTFQLPINGGTNGYVLTTDGTGLTSWQSKSISAAGITSLNGLTASSQFFANGFAGIQPQFNSALNTHTLNIPLASSYGVLAGLVTSTDYYNFQSTYSTVNAPFTIIGDIGSVSGPILTLKANATAGNTLNFIGTGTTMTLNSAVNNIGAQNVYIGNGAGTNTAGSSQCVTFGYQAGLGAGGPDHGLGVGFQAPLANRAYGIGYKSGASSSIGYAATGVGYQAAANGIGYQTATGSNSGAIGASASAGTNSTAIGYLANTSGVSSTLIGALANARFPNATGIGYQTNAFAQASALGYQTTATTNAVAIGYLATATGANSVAIGNNAVATLSGSLTIGNQVTASGVNSIILGGISNTVTGTQATVIGGNNNQAAGLNSYALGQFANAVNNYSFVFSDSTTSPYQSRANNSFNVRAAGGAYFDAQITLTGALNFVANNGTTTLKPNASTASYTFQLPVNGGTNNYVLTTDGTGVTSWQPASITATGITTLNGLTVQNQFFANGYSGLQPAFNSLGTTHTLNIPLASSYGVLAGLITSTDYYNFKLAASYITTITGDTGSVSGRTVSLQARNTAGSTVTFQGSGSSMTLNVTDITKFNTILGLGAGNLTLTGTGNTAFGYQAGNALTSGSNNTFIGAQAGLINTIGNFNTFVGTLSGSANVGGTNNTFIGYQCGLVNTGSSNTLLGSTSGFGLTTGTNNITLGQNALRNLTTGSNNIIVGQNSGSAYTSSESNNIIIGYQLSGRVTENNITRISNTYIADTASSNIFAGVNAGNTSYTVNTANNNSALGVSALSVLTTGTNNTALGAFALASLTTGTNNIAIGLSALSTLTNVSNAIGIGQLTQVTAPDGIALGRQAQAGSRSIGIGSLSSVLSSSAVGIGYTTQAFTQATALGYQATATTSCVALGYKATATGIASVAIGNQAFAGGNQAVVINGSNNTATGIASFAIGTNASATANGSLVWADGSGTGLTSSVANSFNVYASGGVYMQGINGANVGTSSPVLVSTVNGQLGTVASSQRYKDNIKPMTSDYSNNLLALQPVTFNYKQTPAIENFGLIAEEVHELFPELVIYNDRGEPESVKYHELPVLLLNELKKSNALKAELQKTIDYLQNLAF